MQLSDTVAVVTGGASGLGEATVRNFVEGGARVAIFDMNAERGEMVASELGEAVIFQKVDVTSEEDVQAGVDAAMKAFGKITANVNCAGIAVAQSPRLFREGGVHLGPLVGLHAVLLEQLREHAE